MAQLVTALVFMTEASTLLHGPPRNETQNCLPYKKSIDIPGYILVGINGAFIIAIFIIIYLWSRKMTKRRESKERQRNQSESNAGEQSTFSEELHRSLRARGHRTREPEREALRIGKKIEGKENLNDDLNIDLETGFASSFMGANGGKNEIILLNSHNTETFGGPSSSFSTRPFVCRSKANDGTQASSSYSAVDEAQLTEPNVGRELYQLASNDCARNPKAFVGVNDEAQIPKVADKQSSSNSKEANSNNGGSSSSAMANAPPPCVSSKLEVQADSSRRASDQPGSSMGSEKPTLTPSKKEFKLNPNAPSFIPSRAPLWPSSRVSTVELANASTVPHIHGMPMGPQPVVYRPMATPMQLPQWYLHPYRPPLEGRALSRRHYRRDV